MSERAPVKFLVGKRLYLRPVEEADLEACRRWINDPEVREHLLNAWPHDALGEKSWFDSLSRGMPRPDITLAIVLNDGDRYIGNIGLHQIDWRNRLAETGTLIGEKDCWGQGYGPEAKLLILAYAFDSLGLHRLTSRVMADNKRSLTCQKKCGYVEEGRRRQAYFVKGRWVDEVVLGILAEEWRAARKA